MAPAEARLRSPRMRPHAVTSLTSTKGIRTDHGETNRDDERSLGWTADAAHDPPPQASPRAAHTLRPGRAASRRTAARRSHRRAPRRRPGGQRALLLHVRLRVHRSGDDVGRLPALRHRAGLVASGTRERAGGIEPPFLAWEANVLAIGQRPQTRTRIATREVPLAVHARPRLLARHA